MAYYDDSNDRKRSDAYKDISVILQDDDDRE